ncbi:MAG TPA: AI-2E family transporter, partial [Thermoleophilaceae bacterium]|nr:AI-2E family transporter [Thermoleophilaceae bacterium]
MAQPGSPSSAELVPIGLRRASAYAWRLLLLLGVAVLVVWVLVRLQSVVLPVVTALLLAALLDPLARRLRATPLPNWAVALTVLLALLAVLAIAGLIIVPQVIGQIRTVNFNVAAGVETIQRFVLDTFPISQAQLERGISSAFDRIQSGITGLAGQVVGFAGVAAELVIGLFV